LKGFLIEQTLLEACATEGTGTRQITRIASWRDSFFSKGDLMTSTVGSRPEAVIVLASCLPGRRDLLLMCCKPPVFVGPPFWAAIIIVASGGCNTSDTGVVSKDADAVLSGNPALLAVKQYDPTAYKQLASVFSTELANGAPNANMVEDIAPRVTAIAVKRLPTASDPAVIAFANVVAKEIGELRRQDPEACVRWLYPARGSSVDLRNYASQELPDSSYAALAEIVKSSAEGPQAIPTLEEVAGDQQLISAELRQQYGEKVALLTRVHDSSVDTATVCAIAADSFGYMLQLPPERAARQIRYMYSKLQYPTE
jgi:hypothetical protein